MAQPATLAPGHAWQRTIQSSILPPLHIWPLAAGLPPHHTDPLACQLVALSCKEPTCQHPPHPNAHPAPAGVAGVGQHAASDLRPELAGEGGRGGARAIAKGRGPDHAQLVMTAACAAAAQLGTVCNPAARGAQNEAALIRAS